MFRRNLAAGVVTWEGAPDDAAAHLWLRDWLSNNLRVPFLPLGSAFSNSTKGNLGEAIATCLGVHFDYSDCYVYPANAWTCTSLISKTDIDIAWLRLGPDPAQDMAILQEVKTTDAATLALADRLTGDYSKLFGVAPGLTLQTRLGAIAVDLRIGKKMPDLAKRVTDLSGPTPAHCPLVRLIPTLVHEDNTAAAVTKLVAVRETVAALGWPLGQVHPWSIRFWPLDDRLVALSQGVLL